MEVDQRSGNIQIIFGPMFSGKSTELLRRIRRHTVARKKCVVIKHAASVRRDNTEDLSTHDALRWEARVSDDLDEIERDMERNVEVIGIDEAQFFPNIAAFCEKMANRGKEVIVAALDGTFQRKPFNDILSLVPLAESVVKLSAICTECFSPAAFSYRIEHEKSTKVELIGGCERYKAMCRTCYLKNSSTIFRIVT